MATWFLMICYAFKSTEKLETKEGKSKQGTQTLIASSLKKLQ